MHHLHDSVFILAFRRLLPLPGYKVTNMVAEFERTGFVWESYDEKTGRGRGTHPFTGWSSLVVLIMAELY